jgi:hypothetical protein
MLHDFKQKNIPKNDIKGHNNRQNVNMCISNLDTNRDRKQLNMFERKVYRKILENWRILTNKEFMQLLKTYHNTDNKAT